MIKWLILLLLISWVLGFLMVRKSYRVLKKIKLLPREEKSHYWAFSRVDSHKWTRWRFYIWSWLVPLRIASSATITFIYFLLVKVILFKINLNKKRSFRLTALRILTYVMTRLVLICWGFFWIRVSHPKVDIERYPKLERAEKKASTIVSNHLSHFDIFYQLHCEQPAFIAKS